MPRKKTKKKDLPRVPIFRKIASIVLRLMLKPTIITLATIYAAIYVFVASGYYHKTINLISHGYFNTSQSTGLVLKDVLLGGHEHTSVDEILEAIDVKIGEPILSINLWQIKNNLEKLTWVKSASVERQLPSTLNIIIDERIPVALWQESGKVHLIDSEGEIIQEKNLKKFKKLIILVGNDVPLYAASFLKMIESDPETLKMISSGIRISERRWNVRLYNGVEIKLPEQDPEDAWKFLTEKHKEKNILNSDIQTIDLKVKGKMYLNTGS